MIVEKKVFELHEFQFENGRTIPIEMGYETFGSLNDNKDNAILIIHSLSLTSHCAGKYTESDKEVGYWDALIGSGKGIDTDRYFVISADNLCNVNYFNPMVATSGPASYDFETGQRYCTNFPLPTSLDVINAQKHLLDSLGISHLKAVVGISFGGMCAYQWAVSYPDFVDMIIPVTGTPAFPVLGAISPLQNCIRVAALDPKWNFGDYYDNPDKPTECLHLCVQMLDADAYHPTYYEKTYPRNHKDTDCFNDLLAFSSYEKLIYQHTLEGIEFMDLNHWLYSCKMCMNFDIARYFDGDMDKALSSIKAKVLAISSKHDRLHPAALIKPYIDKINSFGGTAECFVLESDMGNMAGIKETEKFSEKIWEFIG